MEPVELHTPGRVPTEHVKQMTTTRGDVTSAYGLGLPCEVELPGEFSPLGYLAPVLGGRHDNDHDNVAALACRCPTDVDATSANNTQQHAPVEKHTYYPPCCRARLEHGAPTPSSKLTPKGASTNIERTWARHDDEDQRHGTSLRLMAVTMLPVVNEVTLWSGGPTTRAVTETVSCFPEATQDDNRGNMCSTPVSDEGACK